MRSSVDVLGLVYVLWGIWQMIVAVGLGLLFLLLGGGLTLVGIGAGGEDGLGIAIMGGAYGVIGVVAAMFALLTAIPSVLAGIGLRRRRSWARMLAMVLGGLGLLNMPLGTILGVLTFVVLLDKDVAASFDAASRF